MSTTHTEVEATLEDLFKIDQQIRMAKLEIERLNQERMALAEQAADQLGKGGAAFIHDGATLAYVADGRRSLNKEALHAAAEQLPASLLPREEMVTKYPGVGDVDKRAADLRARGIDPDQLFRFAGGRWTVNFRAAEDEA
jgi:hypothetical protein